MYMYIYIYIYKPTTKLPLPLHQIGMTESLLYAQRAGLTCVVAVFLFSGPIILGCLGKSPGERRFSN